MAQNKDDSHKNQKDTWIQRGGYQGKKMCSSSGKAVPKGGSGNSKMVADSVSKNSNKK